MDSQASTAKSYLECMIFDEKMTAKALPFSLLYRITNGFSDSQQIGHGGFAEVYKGLLENGTIAVKKLLSQRSDFDEGKFSGEVRCLMKAKHENIVRFLGYCSDTQGQWVESVMADVRERLLCFEYLPNGGLDKYIKDSSREWGKCYQIIKGVCEGLQYLHNERIVHSDLKPANILLDNDMVPKITDFGISRCFDEKQTHVVTSKIVGTAGYLAPEFFYGKLSFKSDIFSLGVIIIEILTEAKDYPHLKDVLECWRHKVEKLQEEQIRVCTEVAQSCLTYDPVKRPSAQCIIDILKKTEPQASSLVESQTKSPRNSFRIEAIWHSDPDNVARALKAVTESICLFYARDTAKVPLQELYRVAYNLVLHKHGEALYAEVQTTMTLEVQSLLRPLDAPLADGALFLQELLGKWNQHVKAVESTGVMLMYMDRTFVPANHKTPIKELGLRLWRDNMARSDKIRASLIEAVERQRGGEGELVAGVNKMLTELGAQVMEVPCLFFRDGAGELHAAGP